MRKKWTKIIFWIPIMILLLSASLLLDRLYAGKVTKIEKVYRLTILYKSGRMEFQKLEPLEMILPLTIKEKIFTKDGYSENYFLQMFDKEKNIVLRMKMDDPTVTLLEYEDPEEPGRIRSKLVKHDEILFSILIPAPAKAQFIQFSRIVPGQEMVPAVERSHEHMSEMIPLRPQHLQIKKED